MARPQTIQPVRSVATYSITTNTPKKIREVPRSRSKTSTSIETIHTVTIGPSWRIGGSRMPRNLRPVSASESRWMTRYPAKKTAIMIFTNSPGCSEKPKSLIQRFAP